jgi:hypothetical protein
LIFALNGPPMCANPHDGIDAQTNPKSGWHISKRVPNQMGYITLFTSASYDCPLLTANTGATVMLAVNEV